MRWYAAIVGAILAAFGALFLAVGGVDWQGGGSPSGGDGQSPDFPVRSGGALTLLDEPQTIMEVRRDRRSKPRDVVMDSRSVATGDGAGVLLELRVVRPRSSGRILLGDATALVFRSGMGFSSMSVTRAGLSHVRIFGEAGLRVRVLGVVAGGDLMVGGVGILGDPVERADTASGVAGNSLVAGEQRFVDVVGLGGVPPTGVATVIADVDVAPTRPGEAGSLSIGNTTVDFIAATHLFVLLPVNSMGQVELQSSIPADVSLHVRAWTRASGTMDESVVNEGGIYPITGSSENFDVPVSGEALLPLAESMPKAASAVFLEITSPVADATGDPATKRSGAVGSAIADVHDSQATVDLGPTEGLRSVAPVAFVAGSSPPDVDAPQVEITTPAESARVDLANRGSFTLSGWIDDSGGSGVARVELYANDEFVRNADIPSESAAATALGNRAPWSASVSSELNGDVTWRARVVDLAGNSSYAQVQVDVALPEPEAVIIDPAVVELEANASRRITEHDGGEVTLRGGCSVHPGQVLVAHRSPSVPQGLMRKVVAVSVNGKECTVATESASLTDVFLQLRIDTVIATRPERTTNSSPVTETPTVGELATTNTNLAEEADGCASSTGGSPVPAPAAQTRPAAIGVPSEPHTLECSVAVTAGIEHRIEDGYRSELLSATAGLTVTARVVVDIRIAWHWFTPIPDLLEFSSIVEAEATADLQATASDGIELIDQRRPMPGLNRPFVIFAGPLPVYITVEAAPELTYEAVLSGSLQASYHAAAVAEFGVRYTKDAGWQTIEGVRGEAKDNISASISGTVRIGLPVKVSIEFYQAAGPLFVGQPELVLNGQLHGDASQINPNDRMTATTEISAVLTGQGGARLTVPAVDKQIAEYLIDIAELEFSLWRREWQVMPPAPASPDGSIDWLKLVTPLQCLPGQPLELQHLVSHDVIGDAAPETVVAYSCQPSTTSWNHQVEVFGSGYSPQRLGTLLHADNAKPVVRMTVDEVHAEREGITLEMLGWSAQAPGCCHDRTYRQTFTWSEDAFIAGDLIDSTTDPETFVEAFLHAWWTGDEDGAKRYLSSPNMGEAGIPQNDSSTVLSYTDVACSSIGAGTFRCSVGFLTDGSGYLYYIYTQVDESEIGMSITRIEPIGDGGIGPG